MTQIVEVFNTSGTWPNPGVTTLDYVICIGFGADGGVGLGGGGGACAVTTNVPVSGNIDYVIEGGDGNGSVWDGGTVLAGNGGTDGTGGQTDSCTGAIKFIGGDKGTTGGGGAAGAAGNGANGALTVGGTGGINGVYPASAHGGAGGNATVAGTAPGGGGGSLASGAAGRIIIAYTVTVPDISSDGGGSTASLSVPENTTAVTDIDASGALPTATLSITGGADSALFSLTDLGDGTGTLRFISSKDYENPIDANHDNVYVVIITATNLAGTDSQTISVTVTNDVSDDPSGVSQNRRNLLSGF